MKEFSASHLNDVAEAMAALVYLEDTVKKKESLKENSLAHLLAAQNLEKIISHCDTLGLNLSQLSAVRFLSSVKENKITPSGFEAQLTELSGRYTDELKSINFLYIPKETLFLYEKPLLFGPSVSEKFPTAIVDIEESGKCLALGRGTASVFHLMRVMEIGLKALAKALLIPYAPSWEACLKQINRQIEIKHASKPRAWKKVEPFFSECAAHLSTVKIAWRNPTMHVRGTYTEEQAGNIFESVKFFMNHLSSRLKE